MMNLGSMCRGMREPGDSLGQIVKDLTSHVKKLGCYLLGIGNLWNVLYMEVECS